MNKTIPFVAVFLIAATYFFLVPDEHPGNSSLSMPAVSNVSGKQTVEKSESDFEGISCLLYTSPSPRDQRGSRMPSSA